MLTRFRIFAFGITWLLFSCAALAAPILPKGLMYEQRIDDAAEYAKDSGRFDEVFAKK